MEPQKGEASRKEKTIDMNFLKKENSKQNVICFQLTN